MAADVAALADLLPAGTPLRRPWWLRWLRPARPAGLEAVPERYRLQFLLLAAERLPGDADPRLLGEVAAGLAERTAARIPGRLLAAHPDDLDRWFKDHADAIRDDLDALRGALWRRCWGRRSRLEARGLRCRWRSRESGSFLALATAITST